MKKALILGVLGLIGVEYLTGTHKKNAETIGDYLGMGLQGISYDLPNGKVLKIVDLNSAENEDLATFFNYYAIMTAKGDLTPNKHLPKIYYFDAGYANKMMVEQINDELPKDAWRDNIIEYNTPVAMWVMDKYDEPNVVLHPKYGGVKEDLDEARNNLASWFEENNFGIIDDLHEENYGFDDKGNIVFFDLDVELRLWVKHKLDQM